VLGELLVKVEAVPMEGRCPGGWVAGHSLVVVDLVAIALITNADPSGINGNSGPGGCNARGVLVISSILVVRGEARRCVGKSDLMEVDEKEANQVWFFLPKPVITKRVRCVNLPLEEVQRDAGGADYEAGQYSAAERTPRWPTVTSGNVGVGFKCSWRKKNSSVIE